MEIQFSFPPQATATTRTWAVRVHAATTGQIRSTRAIRATRVSSASIRESRTRTTATATMGLLFALCSEKSVGKLAIIKTLRITQLPTSRPIALLSLPTATRQSDLSASLWLG